MLTDAGFTYKGNQLDRPEGQPGQLDIHVISGWSDWVASNQIITKNLAGDRHRLERGARARLGLLAAERVRDEEPDAALADRLPGLAVRLLLRQPAQNAFIPSGKDGTPTGNWEHFADPKATELLEPVEDHAQPGEAAAARDAAREDLPARISRSSRSSSARAGRPTARSTSTASTRRRTSTATRSSRRSRTTSSPSPGSAQAGRPGRNRRGRPSSRRAAPARRPPVYPPVDDTCAGSPVGSSSTSSRSGSR